MSRTKTVKLSRNLIRNIVGIIRANIDVEKIIIFGSRANGLNRVTSDIDIAIQSKEMPLFLKDTLDEELNTLLKIDIVDLNDVDLHCKEHILNEGIVIYEKAKTYNK